MTNALIIEDANNNGKGWTITFHTASFEADTPTDQERGHDWSICYGGEGIELGILYEGNDELTAGEARRLVEMLNKCAVYPIKIERLKREKGLTE